MKRYWALFFSRGPALSAPEVLTASLSAWLGVGEERKSQIRFVDVHRMQAGLVWSHFFLLILPRVSGELDIKWSKPYHHRVQNSAGLRFPGYCLGIEMGSVVFLNRGIVRRYLANSLG